MGPFPFQHPPWPQCKTMEKSMLGIKRNFSLVVSLPLNIQTEKKIKHVPDLCIIEYLNLSWHILYYIDYNHISYYTVHGTFFHSWEGKGKKTPPSLALVEKE